MLHILLLLASPSRQQRKRLKVYRTDRSKQARWRNASSSTEHVEIPIEKDSPVPDPSPNAGTREETNMAKTHRGPPISQRLDLA